MVDNVKIHRCRFVDIAPRPIAAMSLNPTHTVLAVAYDTGDIELYLIEDEANMTCFMSIPGHKDETLRTLTWIVQPVRTEEDKDRRVTGNHTEEGSKQTKTRFPYSIRERLFVGGLNGMMYEVNFESATKSPPVDSYGGALWDLRASSHCQLVAAACDDGIVRLFRPKGIFPEDMDDPEYVKTLTPYSSTVIPASGLLTENPVEKGLEFERGLTGADGRALSVAWHPTQEALFAGSSSGNIVGWDLRRTSPNFGRAVIRMQLGAESSLKREPTQQSTAMIWGLQVLADFSVISGDSLGHVQVWDGRSGSLKHTFRHHDGDILSLSIATPFPEYPICLMENESDESRLPFITNCRWVAAGVDGKVSVMHAPSITDKTEEKQCQENLKIPTRLEWAVESFHRGHSHDIRASAAGVCPAVIASAKQGEPSARLGKKRKRHSRSEDLATATKLRSTGSLSSLVITGGDDCQLCVTDLVSMNRNRRPYMVPPLPQSSRFSLASTGDQRLLLVRHDTYVELWQLSEEEQLQASRSVKVCINSGSNISSADISPDGTFLGLLNSNGLRLLHLDWQDSRSVRLEAVAIDFEDDVLTNLADGNSRTRLLTAIKFLPAGDAETSPSLCLISSDGMFFDCYMDHEEQEWRVQLREKYSLQRLDESSLSLRGLPLPSVLESGSDDAVSDHLSIVPVARFPPLLSSIVASEDGKKICVNDISHAIHLLSRTERGELSHTSLPRKALAAPLSKTFIKVNGVEMLLVALSSFRVVVYDATSGAISDWTNENFHSLPKYFLQKQRKGLQLHSSTVYFGEDKKQKVLTSCREFLCAIDLTVKPNCPWNTHETTNGSTKQASKTVNGKKYESKNFRINDSFYDVCYCSKIPGRENEVVVVESDGTKLMQHLPSELARRQYGM
eukprot:gb/GECG01007541.1/.p1 GENE.gb/GECG01007541.1/~~gb/GECG01007541.1/.p1  ORF type:complete len:904 (+),score=105.47 gb/GECG01007541.1/:1-2712(+)